MTHIIHFGGYLIWVIGAISVAITYLFCYKWFHLHRAQIKTGDFLAGIFNILRKGNVVEAISQCDDAPGPVARMIKVAILEHQRGPEKVRQVMENVALVEIPRMERYLSLLLSLAQIAPMVGLLGTVVGMIDVLQTIEARAPMLLAGELGGGLWKALYTTGAGITVAIPGYLGYNFLVGRVEAMVVDMERSFVEVSLHLDDTLPPGGKTS